MSADRNSILSFRKVRIVLPVKEFEIFLLYKVNINQNIRRVKMNLYS